jgi:hypothetical protein
VLTGKGVTTWRRTLADLIPAAAPSAAPAPQADVPGLPAATRELIGILAAMTLALTRCPRAGRPDP